MTSRAEACPNTVLEALSCGALSVSTDQQPMPEFYRDAAVYYQARNPVDLARALECVLDSTREQREELRRRARAIATEYDWDTTARRTLETLRAAAGTR